jgi:hypothetical protein
LPDRGARADINGFGPLPKSLLVGACLKNLIDPQKSYRADGAESIDSLAAEFSR